MVYILTKNIYTACIYFVMCKKEYLKQSLAGAVSAFILVCLHLASECKQSGLVCLHYQL